MTIWIVDSRNGACIRKQGMRVVFWRWTVDVQMKLLILFVSWLCSYSINQKILPPLSFYLNPSSPLFLFDFCNCRNAMTLSFCAFWWLDFACTTQFSLHKLTLHRKDSCLRTCSLCCLVVGFIQLVFALIHYVLRNPTSLNKRPLCQQRFSSFRALFGDHGLSLYIETHLHRKTHIFCTQVQCYDQESSSKVWDPYHGGLHWR